MRSSRWSPFLQKSECGRHYPTSIGTIQQRIGCGKIVMPPKTLTKHEDQLCSTVTLKCCLKRTLRSLWASAVPCHQGCRSTASFSGAPQRPPTGHRLATRDKCSGAKNLGHVQAPSLYGTLPKGGNSQTASAVAIRSTHRPDAVLPAIRPRSKASLLLRSQGEGRRADNNSDRSRLAAYHGPDSSPRLRYISDQTGQCDRQGRL